ncbi:TIGR03086 family metal-binding protein [Streptomyces sp. NPDC005438]|uniref:TIGR03086 family metal-binding protein n=1 Tax=Streptomyces sp. NPDC005438 TaxID=3156880 RepID=UPI0033B336EE
MENNLDPRVMVERAGGQFAALLESVRQDQWDLPTPCARWTVRDLAAHVVGSTHHYAALVDGGESSAPEGTPSPGPEDYQRARRRLASAYSDDARLSQSVTLVWGTMPGRAALGGLTMDAVTHSWDLARALGDGGQLDPELGEFALGVARTVSAERGEGVPFDEPRPVAEDAEVTTRLAAWLGRDPEWTAPAR